MVGAPVSTVLLKLILNILGRGAAQTKGCTAQSSTNLEQTNDIRFIGIRGVGRGEDMHLYFICNENQAGEALFLNFALQFSCRLV